MNEQGGSTQSPQCCHQIIWQTWRGEPERAMHSYKPRTEEHFTNSSPDIRASVSGHHWLQACQLCPSSRLIHQRAKQFLCSLWQKQQADRQPHKLSSVDFSSACTAVISFKLITKPGDFGISVRICNQISDFLTSSSSSTSHHSTPIIIVMTGTPHSCVLSLFLCSIFLFLSLCVCIEPTYSHADWAIVIYST